MVTVTVRQFMIMYTDSLLLLKMCTIMNALNTIIMLHLHCMCICIWHVAM